MRTYTPSPTEIANHIAKNWEFQFNVVTAAIEVNKSGSWEMLTDKDDAEIMTSLYRHFDVSISETMVRNMIAGELAKEHDPICKFFAGLQSWDRTSDHISDLARTVTVKAGQEERWQKYFRKWMIAAAATALGIIMDVRRVVNHSCLVLSGPQGCGKTTWLNRLEMTPELRFSGAIDPHNKDHAIYASTKTLINLDELETTTKSEWGSIKSLITVDKVTARPPYGRRSIDFPRRASFVASINNTQFLADQTGSRRFLVVEVEKIDYTFERDLVLKAWAQAKALIGLERFWFDQSEIADIQAANQSYEQERPEEALIARYIRKPSPFATCEELTATEITAMLMKRVPGVRINERTVGQVLGKLAFERKKTNRQGTSVRLWRVTVLHEADEDTERMQTILEYNDHAACSPIDRSNLI